MPLSGYLKLIRKTDILVDNERFQSTCHIWAVVGNK